MDVMKKQLFGIYLIVFFLLCSGFVISSPSGIKNIPNHNLADQGDSVGRSVKDIIDATDPNRRITITLAHVSGYLDEDTTYVFSTNETIPNNVTLEIEPGAIISGNATLTINGPFEAGLTKCFDSSVTISFGDGSIEKAYPQWWGAKADGSTDDTIPVEAAIDAAALVFFTSGTWMFNITIDSSNNRLIGASKADTIFRPYSDASVITIDSSGSYLQNNTLSDFYIYGDTAKASQDGIRIIGSNTNDYIDIHNVNIFYCGNDGLSIYERCIWSNFENIIIAYSERHGIYVDTNDMPSGQINLLRFESVAAIANKSHGWRILGESDGSAIPTSFLFVNCDAESNGDGTNTTHGFYISDCRRFNWENVWLESNGTGADGYGNDSCGILIDGIYQGYHTINGGVIVNHHCGIDIAAGSNNAQIEIGGGLQIYHGGTITNPQSGVRNRSTASTEIFYRSVKNTYATPIDDVVDVNGNRHVHVQIPRASAYRTFSGGDTTPSVKQSNFFKTANGSPTVISDFDDGYMGQVIKILIKDGNTTIDFTSSGLKGNNGNDWEPAVNDWMDCVYDGTDWFCSTYDGGSPSAGYVYYPNYNASDQGATGNSDTIKYAVDSLGGNSGTIFLRHNSTGSTTPYSFSTDETIPSHVTLKVEPGAYIDGNATLTINGPFNAELTKCFGSSIDISFGGSSIIGDYPQWWDAKVDGSTDDTTAVESAIDAYSKTFFTAGTWRFNITIDSSGHILEGAGKKDTIFRPYSDAPVIEIDSDGSTVQNTVLRDFYIYGDTTKSSQDGILIDGTNGHYYLNIENVNIYYCGRDGLSIKKTCSLSDFQDMSFAYNERYGIYIDSDSTGTPNILDFINVRSVYNKNHGWRLVGDSTYQPNYITFLNCTSTNNGTGTNTTHGFYVTNCRGLIWHNVRCEANGTGADGYGNDSCGILFDGIYHERHVISGGTIINHHYGINISAGSNNALIEIGGGVSIYHTGTITNPQSGVKNGSSASTEVLYGSVKNTYAMPIDDAVDVNGNYHIHMQVPESPAYRTFTGSDTTPSVKQSNVFKTANGSSTTITDFDDGYRGQIIKVIIKDGNTIIDFTSSGLKGNRNIDWYPAINDWMECVYDGTDWFCNISDVTASGGINNFGSVSNFSANDTTPSIQNGFIFKTANTSSTTITDFDDGIDGQSIKVIVNDAYTSVDFTGSGIKGNSSTDWHATADDWLECVYDGTDWFCSVFDADAKVVSISDSDYNVENYHDGVSFVLQTATADRTATLPAAEIGMEFMFMNSDADDSFRIDVDGTEIFRGGSSGKYKSLDSNGALMAIKCLESSVWEILYTVGTITDEP